MLSSVPGPSGIRAYFDLMDECSQKHADEFSARSLYATTSPLMLPTTLYWKRFFNVLPDRRALSSHLLDEELNQMQTKAKQTRDFIDLIGNLILFNNPHHKRMIEAHVQ